jgi:hypothetical protein
MLSIYRVSPSGLGPIIDVGSPYQIESVVRAGKPGRYHIDEIASEPLPSGHTSRRWGTATRHADGTVAIEPDPWDG